MGSKEYEASSSFSLIAAIKATDLVPSTSSSSTAYGPHNGAYWYFYSGYSIGFAVILIYSKQTMRIPTIRIAQLDCLGT